MRGERPQALRLQEKASGRRAAKRSPAPESRFTVTIKLPWIPSLETRRLLLAGYGFNRASLALSDFAHGGAFCGLLVQMAVDSAQDGHK